MARILLAWELGGNGGHALRLAAIARRLLGCGHEVAMAVQRPDAMRSARDLEGRIALRQAPVWPGLWRHGGAEPLCDPATFGDVLANLGFADSGAVEYLLRAWNGLMTDLAPDILVADFAPLALLAARDRMPRIAVGTGFTVPPSDGATFLPFEQGASARIEETMLLAVANRALDALGGRRLDRLPELGAAEAVLPGTFAPLDPYNGHRREPLLPPFLSAPVPPRSQSGGDAIFAYLPGMDAQGEAAKALERAARAGRRVGLYAPGLAPSHVQALAASGIGVLSRPLAPEAIVAQARIVVCAGGQGLVSLALASGIPLVLDPSNVEQRLTARALATEGLARTVSSDSDLAGLAADDDLLAAARAVRFRFAATAGDYETGVVTAIERMR